MKKITFLLTLMLSNLITAQTFDVETIYNSGPNDKRLNIVILGDGYKESELSKFILDAKGFANQLFSESPYSDYKNYFNVYAIKVPSKESGANHPGTAKDVTEPDIPVLVVDNYFGSAFDAYDIHRLLVPTNYIAINNVLANNFPAYDQVIMIVNSPYYGGSGGNNISTFSMHPAANEIGIHELGHSLGNLADEYYAGDQYANEAANMTQQTDPGAVKWSNWINYDNVGIYQHCCDGDSALWFRPHENCKMRVLNANFCPVCKEGTIERIHAFVNPIDSFTPVETLITAGAEANINFELDLIETLPTNTLSTTWSLNGAALTSNDANIAIATSNLVDGENTLTAVVQDKSTLLRVKNNETIPIYSVQWKINYDAKLGVVNSQGLTADSSIIAYPNPVENILNITFENPIAGNFAASLYSIDGKLIKNVNNSNQKTLKIDMEGMNAGIYIVKYFLDSTYLSSQQIIKK